MTELERLQDENKTLKTALATVAWHVVNVLRDNPPECPACLSHTTAEDNCPVIGVIERLPSPFPEEGVNPLLVVVQALGEEKVR